MSGGTEAGQLVLVTESYPYNRVNEFVDEELPYLTERFGSVVVAPLHRLTGSPTGLPAGVQVDLSLSRLVHRPSPSSWRSVKMSELHRRGERKASQLRWILRYLRAASIHRAVTAWCENRPEPWVAYTYWLGPATAALANGWPGTIVVSRAHGYDIYADRHRPALIPFQREAASAARMIMSASDAGRDYLRGEWPGTKVETRRLGIVDLGGLCPASGDSVLRAISASSVDDNKRVPAIARSLMDLASAGRRVEWLHLGDGPGVGEVRRILDSAPHLPLTADLPGWRPREEVRRILRRGPFDVMLLLSSSEGVPVSLMEARCVGIPCVATDVGGVAEVVHRELDVLVPTTASSTQVVEAIRAAAAKPFAFREQRRQRWRSATR